MTAMKAAQFRECLDVLGLKQTGAEGADTFLGVNESTVRRWARGAIPIPDAVAMLLRLMIARGVNTAAARRYLRASL